MILLFRLAGAEQTMRLDANWQRDEDGRIGSQEGNEGRYRKTSTGEHHVFVQSTSERPLTRVFDSPSDEGSRTSELQYRCSMYGPHQRSLHLPAPDHCDLNIMETPKDLLLLATMPDLLICLHRLASFFVATDELFTVTDRQGIQ